MELLKNSSNYRKTYIRSDQPIHEHLELVFFLLMLFNVSGYDGDGEWPIYIIMNFTCYVSIVCFFTNSVSSVFILYTTTHYYYYYFS